MAAATSTFGGDSQDIICEIWHNQYQSCYEALSRVEQ